MYLIWESEVPIPVYVFLDGSRESAYHRPGDSFGNLHHGIEIPGTGYRETGLDDIDAQAFKRLRDLYLLHGVQLASRHLLTITQGGIKNVDSV